MCLGVSTTLSLSDFHVGLILNNIVCIYIYVETIYGKVHEVPDLVQLTRMKQTLDRFDISLCN